jgi:hypothetical protein
MSCDVVTGCQCIGGTCYPFFSVELPPLRTRVLIFSALQRCSRNIISQLGFSTEILCSFPFSCCLLLIYFMTFIHRCGLYFVVVMVLKCDEGSYLHRCLWKLVSRYLSGETHAKTRTRRQLLGQNLNMRPPEFKIAHYSTTFHDLQFN